MDPLISAINTYQSSGKHTAVTQIVDDLFNEGGGRLFEEAQTSRNPIFSTFAERLAKIARDNRLRKSYLLPCIITFDTSYLCLSSSTAINLTERYFGGTRWSSDLGFSSLALYAVMIRQSVVLGLVCKSEFCLVIVCRNINNGL